MIEVNERYTDVWDALADTAQEAANLKARAELMREILRIAKRSRTTQTALAARLGITQPRLSDLMRGRIDKFSLDALVGILDAAGVELQIEFHQKVA